MDAGDERLGENVGIGGNKDRDAGPGDGAEAGTRLTRVHSDLPAAAAVDAGPERSDRILTIPNVICAIRLAGACSLLGVALAGHVSLFTWMFVGLSLSDWIDGKLARWLNQRSVFGARLDSFADSVLYGMLVFGMCCLRWDVLRHELWWIGMATASYVLTTSAGLWKFGKIPSYHTYGAKTSHWLTLAGAVCLLLDVAVWPFRVALTAVTLTNLEATAMTALLREWRADLPSIRHAWRARRQS